MCVLSAVSGQDVRAADCNPFVKKGQSPFLTVSGGNLPSEMSRFCKIFRKRQMSALHDFQEALTRFPLREQNFFARADKTGEIIVKS